MFYPPLHLAGFTYNEDTFDESFPNEIFGLSPLHEEHGPFFGCEIRKLVKIWVCGRRNRNSRNRHETKKDLWLILVTLLFHRHFMFITKHLSKIRHSKHLCWSKLVCTTHKYIILQIIRNSTNYNSNDTFLETLHNNKIID